MVIPKGIAFRLTISKGVTFAISAVASTVPEMGDNVLPMDAENSIGKIINVALIPSVFESAGTNGPKEKNAAFPLPIRMEAKKIISVITILIPMPPRPKICELDTSPSINIRLINPLENISAAIIKVTTDLKILPIPSKNIFNN